MSTAASGPCDEALIRHAEGQPCGPTAGRWVLAATILGSSMAFIDQSVVNVALPVLQESLAASVSSAQWIIEAYSLFLASLVLVGGALGDRFGRRRIFSVGTLVFTAASLGCGLAPNVHTLIAARAAQGVGAALLIPSSLSILGAAFSPQERGRAVGTWAGLTALAGAIGPALGGWLVQIAGWRSVFLINLPIAGIVLAIALRKVPETKSPRVTGLDLAGALLATLGLGALVYGLIEAPAAGWDHPRVWASIAGGAAALVGFVLVERRARHPMVPLGLFRNRTFTATNLLTLFLYAAMAGVFFFLSFELIQARGYSPAAAGASTLPLMVFMAGLSRWTGGLVDRFGPRLPLVVGPTIAAAGFALLALLPPAAGYAASLLPALSALGLGMAITVAPLTATVLNSVDRDDTGTASGINNAVARVAALLAIAVYGIAAYATFNRSLDRELASAGVSSETRRLLEPERMKLGAMKPPAGISEPETGAVKESVRTSLHAAFRLAGMISAALALLAAGCAAWGVRGPKRSS